MSVLREVCNPAARVCALGPKVLRSVEACKGLVAHVTSTRAVDDDLVDGSAVWCDAWPRLCKADASEYYSCA